MTAVTPFRAGGAEPPGPRARFAAAQAGPVVLMSDISEFQPDLADAAYLAWSKAVVIRAAYGDAHDDLAWYGGQRRDLLHSGGARFVGIYQYLVAGQDPAAQAQALNDLVGDLRPGEVLIADFEEGAHAMLTGWYNAQLADRGPRIAPHLWTYTGLNFGQANGALPVEWVAAYGQSEPAVPHKLWQFTSSFPVPGAGRADASVFHGTMDELAALAFPAQPGPPRNLEVRAGDSTVMVTRCDPPAGAVSHFEVSVFTGSYPSPQTLVPSYPRYMKSAPEQFGSLQDVPSGTHMTLRAVAVAPDGTRGEYADAHFAMP